MGRQVDQRRSARFGPWWLITGIFVVGFAVFVIADRALVGGLLMALAFAVWAVMRYRLRGEPVVGIAVRSVRFDLVTQLAFAVNVAGAVLLTVQRMDWRPLAVVDVALLVALVVVVRQDRRARSSARS